MLSEKEKATNFETMQHIRQVGIYLNKFVRGLMERAEVHDQSKLQTPEVEAFTEFTSKLAASTYGSPEYDEFKKAMKPAGSPLRQKSPPSRTFPTRRSPDESVGHYRNVLRLESCNNAT